MAKKENGIKGRPSDATIQKRKKICLDLRNLNPTVQQDAFLKLLKKEYAKNGIELPSEQTIKRNLKDWGIDFKNPKKNYIEHTDFNALGDIIKKNLRQIHLSFENYNKVIFNCEKISKDNNETGFIYENKKCFIKELNKWIGQKEIRSSSLLYLSIILKEKGLEKYIGNIFDNNFLSPKPFLYIETPDYCTKIIFEYKNYEEIMDKVYEIVENYSYSDFKYFL